MTRTPAGQLALLWVVAACGGREPRPLVVGEDACDYCRMAITDTRFGGELTLRTGRHRPFDSIECLAAYVVGGSDSTRVLGVFVSDYETQTLIDATTAVYVRGGAVRSPMGRGLSAFARRSDPAALVAKYGGQSLDWTGVLQQAASERVTPSPPAPPAKPGPPNP